MKKKLVSVLVSVAVVATMLVGCGAKAETAAPAATEAAPAATEAAPAATEEVKEEAAAPAGDMSIEIVSKGFQHQYWQAVLKGAQQKADELGVKINFVGPNSESDIADQVQMLNSAINTKPQSIALAALDTSACLDAISAAQAAGIPIVGFDSGVPDAPEGAVVANASTDNYAAGELAAEETYKVLKDRIAAAKDPVRIGVMGQDATSESIVNRGLGFIDKMASLIAADGKTVSVEGNDRYVSDSKVEKADKANVIIDVAVPAQVTSELSALDCQTLLNKADTICIYGSNQHSGEAMVTANENLKKFGATDDKVIGVAFDSGVVIKGAVKDGTFIGAVTQAPVAMGEAVVDLCVKAAKGETVSDVDTGCQWFTAANMDSEEIAQNLYD
ncbi:MAG: substrate-binding domain-containing protein [Lachnospiraceae bacterium]